MRRGRLSVAEAEDRSLVRSARVDGSTDGDRDDVETYWLVRRAVRDGIWDVIGTVVTVVVAAVLVFLGLALVSQGLSGGRLPGGALLAAVGAVLVVGAVVMVLRELRLWPFDGRP